MLSICLVLLNKMVVTLFPVSLVLSLLPLNSQWHRVRRDPLSLSAPTLVTFVLMVIGHVGEGEEGCIKDVSQ